MSMRLEKIIYNPYIHKKEFKLVSTVIKAALLIQCSENYLWCSALTAITNGSEIF
jgi:hypothetical protein